MNMKQFLTTYGREEASRVAKDAGTTFAYLEQIAGGHRKPGFALTRKLVLASGKRMTLEALRPDVYGEVTPA